MDQIHDDYSFIGCSFDQNGTVDGTTMTVRQLTISSTNITLDEFRKRDGTSSTVIQINGQDAIVHPDGPVSCFLETSGPDGALDIQLSIVQPHSAEQPCGNIKDIANVVQGAVSGK